MLRFAHSEYLYALYLIPVMVIFFWYTRKQRRKALLEFADEKVHEILFPMKSKLKPWLKFILIAIAYLFLVVGLANPQIGSKIEEVKQVGIDVYVLLDVSLSMTAQDIKPSRLEKAKHDISNLIQKLHGDRIGLIVFAGQSYVQFPLTTDYGAAKMMLDAVSTNSVPEQGTAIASSIEKALASFKKNTETKKAIIVITDGEDHEGNIDKAVKDAVDKGVVIYTIGLGSPEGVPIPIYNASGVKTGYKKDRYGRVVLTKLNDATLQRIASSGNGKYYHGSNDDNELEKIYSDLGKIKKSEFGTTKITDYEDRFYYFLAFGLFLIIMEFFISERKSSLLIKLNRTK